jgi:glucose-1-phosphate adenylyltransferase
MTDSGEVLAVILGGGKGTRLYPLTRYRAKPAVPIGGKFRIIDIPISNCLNSDIQKIFILTQFNTHSLHRHIYGTYRLGRFSKGFVDILAAQQTIANANWYQGTADAVRQNLSYIKNNRTEFTLILSGDHLYRMDYRNFLKTHTNRKADLTISVKPVAQREASEFGILQMDKEGKIVRFVEKPDIQLLKELKSPGLPADTPFLASMGIYIFNTSGLVRLLEERDDEDFGRGIIPWAISNLRVYAHQFNGYWRDIGTIESFFMANLELASLNPPFSFYDERAPFYTRARFLPGSRMESCQVDDTLMGEGCFISKSVIHKAVVGIRMVIRTDVHVDQCVLMGADYYEFNPPPGLPGIGIGANCKLRNAIIDKNARIGNNVSILNNQKVLEYEAGNYSIRDGIVVVPKNAVIPDGTVI